VPMLAGGVGVPEILRKSAALVRTLWFALGAGLCGSALQRDRSRAFRGTILFTLLLLLVPLLSFAVSTGGVLQYIGLLSPLVLTITASDSVYTTSAQLFWVSLSLVQALVLALVIGAGLLLHRAVVLDNSAVVERPLVAVKEAERAIGLGRWQPDKEDSDPVEWLVFRGRGVSAAVWLLAVVGLVGSRSLALVLPFLSKPRGVALSLVVWPLGVGGALLGGAMVASVASRFFSRVRRTGELELLLTSPVGAKTLVSDQWKVLSRVFVWPVAGLQGAILLPLLLAAGRDTFPVPLLALGLGLNVLNTGLGAATLCWGGMRFGLTARLPLAATALTVALAQGVPWMIIMVTGVIPILPDILLLIFYAILLPSTRGRLLRALAEGEAAA
jgi:hypothetical protein